MKMEDTYGIGMMTTAISLAIFYLSNGESFFHYSTLLYGISFIGLIFINKAFNLDGSYKDTIFNAKPSKWNCTFCPYKEKPELCSAVGKNF